MATDRRPLEASTVKALRRYVQPESIPAHMCDISQWVCWGGEYRGENPKISKVPKDPKTGRFAKSTDPATWGTYQQAVARFKRDRGLCGIGFVFSESASLTGIDLDNCRNPETGVLEPWAREILETLNTYSEVSPSQTGVKAFCIGRLPEGVTGGKSGDLEMYHSGRFFTVTGQRLGEYPAEPREVEDATLPQLWSRMKGKKEELRQANPISLLEDAEIIRRVREARNGDKFSSLWGGDISGYPSHSEADSALCTILGFWTQEQSQIDRLFRRSGLMRAKWDKSNGDGTYGSRTIGEALSRPGGERWTPGGKSEAKSLSCATPASDSEKQLGSHDWIEEQRTFPRIPFPWEIFPPSVDEGLRQLAMSCASSPNPLPGHGMRSQRFLPGQELRRFP